MSPPSESPVFSTVIFDNVDFTFPNIKTAFSSALVDLYSPDVIFSSLVISFGDEYETEEFELWLCSWLLLLLELL